MPVPPPALAPPQLVNNKGELKIADFGLARYFRKVRRTRRLRSMQCQPSRCSCWRLPLSSHWLAT